MLNIQRPARIIFVAVRFKNSDSRFRFPQVFPLKPERPIADWYLNCFAFRQVRLSILLVILLKITLFFAPSILSNNSRLAKKTKSIGRKLKQFGGRIGRG